ncbi:hypothetical protein JKA74_02805 [Marivirga sp. S37H4]|uniref:Uncharacterized protein n=1 Tax=Marivirga aurantiaca TaxID=2802615 RepID=A0A934WVS5_9BACT|nr:hypothetical protein [Marivirga aurantiaca]MBK6263954.1 hypothetical protein [Marivirga aurantiaca]
MVELPLEYWNALAHQILLTTALLSGFSIAVVANLLVYESKSRIVINILRIATVAAGCFLINVFSMTKIIMLTTDGYPLEVVDSDINLARIIGVLSFFLGIISLAGIISLSGFTKSRKAGIFTTIVGVLTLLGILFMIT